MDLKYQETIKILPQQPKIHFHLSKIGNKRSRRSRRLEPPSPTRQEIVETPNPGNITLTNSYLVDQEKLGPNVLENQLTEPSLISNEIQVWTQEMEKRNNDRIGKMREEN